MCDQTNPELRERMIREMAAEIHAWIRRLSNVAGSRLNDISNDSDNTKGIRTSYSEPWENCV